MLDCTTFRRRRHVDHGSNKLKPKHFTEWGCATSCSDSLLWCNVNTRENYVAWLGYITQYLCASSSFRWSTNGDRGRPPSLTRSSSFFFALSMLIFFMTRKARAVELYRKEKERSTAAINSCTRHPSNYIRCGMHR